MLKDEIATARVKREAAELRRHIELVEQARAELESAPSRTPEDELRLARSLDVAKMYREKLETLERMVEGGLYVLDVAEE